MPWFTQRNPPEEGEKGSKWKIRFIPQRWLLIKEQVDVAAELKAFFSSLPCFFFPQIFSWIPAESNLGWLQGARAVV